MTMPIPEQETSVPYHGRIYGDDAKMLKIEADRRGMTTAVLVKRVVELVVRDDLFRAVLDD